ncbi:MAG TPA: wax ester/triacylglycerol synthase family O-acyltransferase [Acidimicrobiia bacterium]
MSSERFDHHMSDADALMWNMEKDPILRSTIVTVGVLDRSPDWGRFVDKIERGSRLIPRLRQHVVTPPLRLGPPHWSADEHFDLSYHLRRVRAPEPATFETVLDLARNAAMESFDRARPLWEYTLVDGLADGRAAAIMKVHHSMTDGVGGMRLAMMLFDLDRAGDDSGPLPDATDLQVISRLDVVRRSLWHRIRRAEGIAIRGARDSVSLTQRFARHPVDVVEEGAVAAQSIARFLAPATTPLSSIMRARTLARRLAIIEVPLDDLKRAAKAAGGTLNDAFIAAVIGGFQRYHEIHGAPVDTLRMTMPVNVRGSDATMGGNHFTPARFLVPLAISDPAERISAIAALSRQVRDEPALQLTDALAGVLNMLPVSVTAALFGAMLKGADFVTSNVPGPPFPVYVAGAEMTHLYAFAPLAGAAANITLVSNAGTCCIGINTDAIAVPDSESFVKSLEAAFGEILALA